MGFRDDSRRKGRAVLFPLPSDGTVKQSSLPASPVVPPIFRKTNCHPYCHVQGPNRKSNHIRKNYSTAHDGQHCDSNSSVFYFLYDVTPTGLSAPFGNLSETTSCPASTTAVLSFPPHHVAGKKSDSRRDGRGPSPSLRWDAHVQFLRRRRSFHVSCPNSRGSLLGSRCETAQRTAERLQPVLGAVGKGGDQATSYPGTGEMADGGIGRRVPSVPPRLAKADHYSLPSPAFDKIARACVRQQILRLPN